MRPSSHCRSVFLSLGLILCALLLPGCGGGGKDKPPSGPGAASEAGSGTTSGGRPQDAFESMSDPPFNANTRFAAGQLAESQGNADRAVAQYREALKLDPNHAQSLFRLGALHTDRKQYDEAITIWQRYLKVTNNAPAAYNNLAFCYERAGRADEAEQAYRAGIERDPRDASCRVNYGLMLARRGRTGDAVAQLGAVLSPAEVHYNLGSVYEQQGKRAEAKAYYTKALELDPKLRDARARLAALK